MSEQELIEKIEEILEIAADHWCECQRENPMLDVVNALESLKKEVLKRP